MPFLLKNSLLSLTSFLLLLVLVGCGPVVAQNITQVTPLPTGTVEASAPPAPTNTALVAADPTATPTPLDIELPQGSAAAQVMATDIAMQPENKNPVTFDSYPVPIRFDEFYAGFDMRKGLTLTDKLLSLDGKEVVMEGYMAPPLKPQLDWFVLTNIRLEFCPFCSSDADWPMDIAVIYLTSDTLVATQVPVRVHGRMEIGSAVDPETGMVSLVRIYADKISLLQ